MSQADKQRMFCESILRYVSQAYRAAHWEYKAEIIADGKVIPIEKVVELTVESDYEKDYTSTIVLGCQVNMLKYHNEIYPKRENFHVRLHRIERHENPTFDLAKPRRIQKLFRGILIDSQDKNIGSTQDTQKIDNKIPDKDKRIMVLKIQLIDFAIEKLRQVEIGGIFTESVPADVVKALLTTVVENTDIPHGNKLDGVELVPPDMQDPIKQILVPHATNCLVLPEYIQKSQGGIYNHDVGLFIHRNVFYVYPLYNLQRYEKEKLKATIVVMPKGYVGETKRTFVTNNGELILITTSEVSHVDVSNTNQIQKGTGRVVVDMNKMLSDAVTVKDNKLTVDSSKGTSAFVQNKRKDGLNYVPTKIDESTTTMANNLSNTSATQGRVMTCIWEWATDRLIFPGMPCRVIYFKDNRKYQMDGVIMKTKYHTQMMGNNLSSRQYKTDCGLGLYIQKQPSPTT